MTSNGGSPKPTPARHLHAIALVGFFIETLREWIVPIAGGVIGSLALYRKHPLLFATVIAILVVFALVWPVLKYFTFTYQLLDQEIYVKHGLIFRKQNHVPYDRIQNVAVKQWFFLKPFDLVTLEVETAGHSDEGPEVTLIAVPLSLRDELSSRRRLANIAEGETAAVSGLVNGALPESQSETNNTANKPTAVYEISTKDLLKFAATSPAFLTALLAIMAVYGRLQKLISEQLLDMAIKDLGQAGWVVIVLGMLAVVLVLYLGSIVVIVIQYYRFTLSLSDGQLMTVRGLFQRNTVTLAQSRIQAVRVSQPLLRSWLHMATIKLIVVSNSKKEKDTENVVIMPLIAEDDVDGFLQRFVTDIPVDQVRPSRQSGRTLYYQLRNFGLVALGIVLAITGMTFPWPRVAVIADGITIVLVVLLLIIPAYLTARRTQVQVLNDHFAFAQTNFLFTREQYYVPRQNVQSLLVKQSKWLQQRHFASLTLNVRAGSEGRKVTVRYLPDEAIYSVYDWYRQVD
ncbi:PH domain-containing protein [Furfurilactobacillus cerevisiae]|uniref:PH domain-containing protein n=1 Tax=Furfurilactobacillus rossiae TaxID=231049 RepID=UPI003B97F6C1